MNLHNDYTLPSIFQFLLVISRLYLAALPIFGPKRYQLKFSCNGSKSRLRLQKLLSMSRRDALKTSKDLA